MKALLLSLLAAAQAPVDHPRSYLLTIANIPLRDSESINGFSIQTWGVQFAMVCRIPDGWRIKAGSSATPNGELSGTGSQGATWFQRASPPELRAFVLVTLSGPARRADIRSRDGSGIVPATFKGHATISTDGGDVRRPMTARNIVLTPARHCPARR